MKFMLSLAITFVATFGTVAEAGMIVWTDWQTSNFSGVGNMSPFTAMGTLTTTTSTVDVTYNNPQGVHVFHTGSGTDYFQNGPGHGGRNATDSPYTSALVDNIPTAGEMIALQFAGNQTLTFSETIANPVFSYVSLNGNGYAFDQDFEILSFGDSSDGNDPGFFGSGTSFKNVVDLGGGDFEYQLLGTGEPHGTIRFTGAFDTVSWRSLSNEAWNGFTVGIDGTAAEVFPSGVPEPSSILLAFAGMLIVGIGGLRRQRKLKTMTQNP